MAYENKRNYRYSENAKQIDAVSKEIVSNEKALEKIRLKMRCNCNHKDANGAFALIPPHGNGAKSEFTNAPLYRCRVCQKQLDLTNISEDEFRKAVNAIDRVCDLIKMKADGGSDEEIKMIKSVSKFQYKLQRLIVDGYSALRKGKKHKNNNRNNDRTVEIMRPTRR